MKTYYIIIEGRVQGIGFRYFTLNKALEYNITGTVRNNNERDSVEIYCQGMEDKIKCFLECIKKGPVLSAIINIKTEIIEQNPYEDFRIIM